MDPMDEYLEKRLQNWAAMRQPPPNGKARLLRAAAQIAHFQPGEILKLPPSAEPFLTRLLKINTHRNWYWDDSPKFFDWTIVYSFEMRLVNQRLRL